MNKRLKDNPPLSIEDLASADKALLALCRCLAELAVEEAALAEEIAQAREAAALRTESLTARRDQLTRGLTRFIADHSGLIPKGKRSVALTHGELGIRALQGKLKAIAPNKKAAAQLTAQALVRLAESHPECIISAEKIDLKALRKLGPDEYKSLGFDLVGAREEPWCKPSLEIIESLAEKLAPEEA